MEKFRQLIFPASKKAVIEGAEYLMLHKHLIDEVMKLAITDEKRYSWHAAWVIKYLAEIKAELIINNIDFLARNIENIVYESSLGSILKVFVETSFNLNDYLNILDFCIEILPNSKKSFIKYYALDILQKYAIEFPELKPEIIQSIEISIPHFETKSLKNKAQKLIKTKFL